MRGNIYLIVRWQEQRGTISSSGCESGVGGRGRGVEGGVHSAETLPKQKQAKNSLEKSGSEQWRESGSEVVRVEMVSLEPRAGRSSGEGDVACCL